ncbi:hypothetical protein MUK42_33110 [Musa troglodytarum]|uniref:Uncharacterized protein n=1 Tax=Musa troglodytarum TaxID=320322 RepID=A0A9E7GEI8_9LILI|nr:hypothetical protein MUK42_33110 [Musa troglodytarum]
MKGESFFLPGESVASSLLSGRITKSLSPRQAISSLCLRGETAQFSNSVVVLKPLVMVIVTIFPASCCKES